MVSPIEPDRYANTGYSVRDTSPEINEMMFQHTLRMSPSERFQRACSLNATARALIWSSIPTDLPEVDRRQIFLERFYGKEFADSVRGKI